MFSELGYDAATFQEIAERAELTRPAINHYFPGKRALYQQVVEQTNQLLLDAGVVQARVANTFVARVEAFIDAVIEAQQRDPASAAFLMTSVVECRRHPDLTPEGRDALTLIRRFVDQSLEQARADGEMTPEVDTAALSEAVLAMLLGLGFYAGFVGARERLTPVADNFLSLLRGQVFHRSA